MDALLDGIALLDRHPPRFKRVEERARAFRQIGGFFETQTRAGHAHDLAKSPCAVWPPLQERLARAVNEIADCELRRDEVRLWQMYNHGVIIKSDEVVMGLDLVPLPRRFGWEAPAGFTQRLAGILDLLMVTHRHDDHYDRELAAACLRLGKPVFMPASLAADWGFDPNLHPVGNDWTMEIDDLRIRGQPSLHVWRKNMDEVPLVAYEVTCQEGYTFLFSGDADYTKSLEKPAYSSLDLLFIPWRNPNERYEKGHPKCKGTTLDAVNIALRRVEPAAVLHEHYAELKHVYDGFPASYDIALDLQEGMNVPSDILFWGESLVLAPGNGSAP